MLWTVFEKKKRYVNDIINEMLAAALIVEEHCGTIPVNNYVLRSCVTRRGRKGFFIMPLNMTKSLAVRCYCQKKKKADSALWVKALSLMVCIMDHLMWHMHPRASGSS